MIPECCGCGVKFYMKPQVTPWKLLDVSNLKGNLVPESYLSNIGLLCGTCVQKGILIGVLDPKSLDT